MAARDVMARAALCAFLVGCWTSRAAAEAPTVPSMQALMVKKDARERIAKDSTANYHEGVRVAREMGLVPVWIVADAPFDPDIPVEDSRWGVQQDRIRAVQDSVIARLETHTGGPISVSRTHIGPYFAIRATVGLLDMLARDHDVQAFYIFVPN